MPELCNRSSKDFDLFPVLFDHSECVVRGGGLDGVIELDVGDLLAADDFFLDLGGQLVPAVEIMKVFLDDDVAPACEGGVFFADEDGVCRRAAGGIFGAVNKAQEVAFVEVAETVDFVCRGDGPSKARHDLRGEFKAQIHVLSADMEEQVSGRGNRVARAGANLAKGMQFRGTRRSKQAVPGVRAEAHDAGESGFEIAKANSAQKRREIRAQRKNRRATFLGGVDGKDEKNGSAGEWRGDELRDHGAGGCRRWSADWIGRHRQCSSRSLKDPRLLQNSACLRLNQRATAYHRP